MGDSDQKLSDKMDAIIKRKIKLNQQTKGNHGFIVTKLTGNPLRKRLFRSKEKHY